MCLVWEAEKWVMETFKVMKVLKSVVTEQIRKIESSGCIAEVRAVTSGGGAEGAAPPVKSWAP